MTSSVLQRMELRASQAESLILSLKQQLEDMRKKAFAESLDHQKNQLVDENEKLRKEIAIARNNLIQLEIKNGVKQIGLPGESTCVKEDELGTTESLKNAEGNNEKVSKENKENVSKVDKSSIAVTEKQEKKAKPAKKSGSMESKNKPSDDQPIDVRRLDFRIGRILSVKKHPDADALYVEDVDVGEEKTRTVVSGLVKHVPLEDMQNRLVMLLCNLKPAKMRGIVSEAMVMCASTPEKVEILVPPSDSVPGDVIVCKGYEGIPDKELNQKKKIFEQIAPDLKTNEELKASYKDVPLEVPGKGFILAKSLRNVQVK